MTSILLYSSRDVDSKKFANLFQLWKYILFQIEFDLGNNFGLSSKLSLETDAQYNDLFSYWEKLRQHSPASVLSLGLLPSSIRKFSAKLIYNPAETDIKELTVHFSLGWYLLIQAKLIHFFVMTWFYVNNEYSSFRVQNYKINVTYFSSKFMELG